MFTITVWSQDSCESTCTAWGICLYHFLVRLLKKFLSAYDYDSGNNDCHLWSTVPSTTKNKANRVCMIRATGSGIKFASRSNDLDSHCFFEIVPVEITLEEITLENQAAIVLNIEMALIQTLISSAKVLANHGVKQVLYNRILKAT